MRRRFGLMLVMLVLVPGSVAVAEVAESPDVTNAVEPFQPQLIQNDDPLCPAILVDVRKQYQTLDDLSMRRLSVAGLALVAPPFGDVSLKPDPDFKADETDPMLFTVTLTDGDNVFLRFARIPGCGGACEGQLIAVSSKADFNPWEGEPADKGSGVMRTPGAAAEQWFAYSNSKGNYYVAAVMGGFVEVYQVSRPKAHWPAVCKISVAPDEASLGASAITKAPMQSLLALNALTDAVAGGAGDCGTLRTAGRWVIDRRRALLQALYHPWTLHNESEYQPPEDRARGLQKVVSENTFGDYGRIEPQLEEWSVGGLFEYRIFQKYQAQHAATVKVLAGYYQKVYGLDSGRATASATEAINNAISQGFGFYQYVPYSWVGERELRQALLEHRPLGEIKAIKVDPEWVDKSNSKNHADSVLNVAIEYPEALQWLIGKGLNPNQANMFGKTPLMYAAQDNQLDAARILIAAGADVNAATFPPEDTCSYTLDTTAVTALHYAVRNASADVIKLLLQHGAATFARANAREEYPLDWLRLYAPGSANPEINSNVSSAELSALEQLLQPPSQQQLQSMAQDRTLKGESLYSSGKFQESEQVIKKALVFEPDNERALSDLSIIALHNGDYGLSLKASTAVLARSKTSATRAAAWFNTGLACEKVGGGFGYQGGYYCRTDSFESYVRSWQEQASAVRADKIRELARHQRSFDTPPRMETCVVGGTGDAPDFRVQSYLDNRNQRLYVWQRAGAAFDPGTISLRGIKPPDIRGGTGPWAASQAPMAQPVSAVSRVVSRLDLGGDAVTILEAPVTYSDARNGIILTIMGKECRLY